jgi:hypothetical protein
LTKAAGEVFAKRAEAVADPLPDWLERLEAGAAPGRVQADALGAVVVNGDEDGDLALTGPGRGHVGAPHDVHPVGNDGAVVVARPPG